jgi:hypothetical protein
MACNHIGGPELIEMAEAFLVNGAVPRSSWTGRRFRWSENLSEGMWASVVLEIERQDDQWLVTRIDRNREPVEETGFRELP